jgi:hypothetical protein
MGSIRSFYFLCTSRVCTLTGMGTERDRVISITLSEAEWQAFVARHPQPVNWLRDRIRDEVRVPDDERGKSAA